MSVASAHRLEVISELLTPDVTLIAGEGLRLRRFSESQAADLVRIRANPEFVRWCDPVAITHERAVEMIEQAEARWQACHGALLGIFIGKATTPVGVVDLAFDDHTRGRIGYDVAPEFRGMGLATAALRLVSRWAFALADGVVRLELQVLPGNDASVAVAERAGFQREGIARSRFPFGDEFRDVIVYSLVRDDL